MRRKLSLPDLPHAVYDKPTDPLAIGIRIAIAVPRPRCLGLVETARTKHLHEKINRFPSVPERHANGSEHGVRCCRKLLPLERLWGGELLSSRESVTST